MWSTPSKELYNPTRREKLLWLLWKWPESNNATTLDIPPGLRVVFKWLPTPVALK